MRTTRRDARRGDPGASAAEPWATRGRTPVLRRRGPRPSAAALVAAGLFLSAAPPLAAQERAGEREEATGPRQTRTLRAVRRQGPVEIDGRLDESAWRAAPAAADFVQQRPVEGAEPARPTEVRILYDDDAIYVGARMHDDPDRIADQLVRRDERGQYDFIEVGFDPNLDRQTAYLFRVSAAGSEMDQFLHDDSEFDPDWNAVWSSAVHRDSLGWTAEMRIPLSQFRWEASGEEQTWGFNIVRRRLASNSMSFFDLVSRTEEGIVSQFGRLEGLRLADAGVRLELEPYTLGQLFTGPAAAGDPFFDGSEASARAGLDVSYGLGPAFSLDATINPDFGQVEVDPEVINLTAFETFFPEKRPFFVQGARVFDFELSGRRNQLFFSRRIGREPRGEAPSGADFVDAPDRTTILGAAKLTGRTQEGLSVGVLGAVTDEEEGRAFFSGSGETRRFLAEPLTGYGVARVQQDMRDGATTLGAIATLLLRDLPEGGSLDFLPSSAYSAGADFEHQWGGPRDRRWALSGFLAGSLVRGSPEAILDLQTNPQHYFQRPDADYLEVDSTATSMVGANWRLQFERQSAEHWTWAVWLAQISPGFAANDLGFNVTGEQLDAGARISYQVIEPGDLFRDYEIRFFTFHNWRNSALDDPFSTGAWGHAHKDGGFFLNGDFTFLNNWSLDAGIDVFPENLSDTETRGGPLMTDPAAGSVDVRLETDPRAPVSLGPSLEVRERFRGPGRSVQAELDVTLRPSPGWEISLEPRYEWARDAAQYVATAEDGGFAPTFGDRYLFADLEQRTLSMEARLNVAFTPDLSFQLFAQPLLSSGDFLRYKQLARAESFEFLPFEEGTAVRSGGEVRCLGGTTCVLEGTRYLDFDGDGTADFSFDGRDFNVRSLRGNAVLRWEYRPGSILFLVWQHDRRGQLGVGDFDLGRDLGGLFDAPAESTFILKVSHFLDL